MEMTLAAAGSSPERRAPAGPPVWPILGAFLGSRLLIVLAALAAETLLTRNPQLNSGASGPLVTSFTAWDGWWYLGIVHNGYHAAPLISGYFDYAFFPLYPLLVRGLAFPFPAFAGLVAVLLSNALFLLALALLYRLTREVLDEDRALMASVYLAIFPFSFVFSMAYAESLFLVLSLGSLLAAERGRAGWAAVLASLAGSTRLTGVLLIVPLALILWRRVADRRSVAWLVLVPLGAGLFYLYVAHLTGTLSGYGAAESAWGRGGVSTSPAGGDLASHLDVLRLSLLATLLAFVFLLVYLRPDRIPLAYATIPVLTLGAVLASGLLESVGRYAMLAFPFTWTLAGRRSAWFRTAWPAVSAGLLGLLALLAFGGYYVP